MDEISGLILPPGYRVTYEEETKEYSAWNELGIADPLIIGRSNRKPIAKSKKVDDKFVKAIWSIYRKLMGA